MSGWTSLGVHLQILLGSAVLLLIYLSTQSFTYKAQVGNRLTVGARDVEPAPAGLAGRAARAYRNYLETWPLFAVLIVVSEMTGHQNALTLWGGVLYLLMRVIYLPLYLAGWPWVRTFSWNLAMIGLVLVLAGLVV